MRKLIYLTCGLFLAATACQTESLDIQRTFPFLLQMDAFPSSIIWQKPTSVGFGVKPNYLTSSTTYMFIWHVAAPLNGVLSLNKKIIAQGEKNIISANMSRLLTDTLTYTPTDSGSHELTIRVFDTLGQVKDTTFTITAVR